MISLNHYKLIKKNHGEHGSFCIYVPSDGKPKSNIGNLDIFDLKKYPSTLRKLNPNIIMIGLNISRKFKHLGRTFGNYHSISRYGQDFKLRFAFEDTKYYGAYMTDIIKDFPEKNSAKVKKYIRGDNNIIVKNVEIFKQELKDLKSIKPTIITFGEETFNILKKHFKKMNVVKIPHYSQRISKENYRKEVHKILGIRKSSKN